MLPAQESVGDFTLIEDNWQNISDFERLSDILTSAQEREERQQEAATVGCSCHMSPAAACKYDEPQYTGHSNLRPY